MRLNAMRNGQAIQEVEILARHFREERTSNARFMFVRATSPDGTVKEFGAKVRIDTPQEILYFEHGGILQYVLRQLAGTVKNSV
jgi:aconitase A